MITIKPISDLRNYNEVLQDVAYSSKIPPPMNATYQLSKTATICNFSKIHKEEKLIDN